MKIFLDTADAGAVRSYNEMGLLDGVTTNPSLLYRERGDPRRVMREIVDAVEGDVSLEVVSAAHGDMIEEGRRLREYGPNVVVKCPMTAEGLRACRALSADGVPVNVTLVFSPNQALLAAKAGAKYVSPFVGRLDDAGHDGMGLVARILGLLANYDYATEVLVASVRHPIHVARAAGLGAQAATLPPAVLEKMLRHPLTDSGLESFMSDWERLKAENPGAGP